MRGSIHAFATDERRPEHGGSLRLARRLRHGAMATNYALTHATATAELAPRLTVAEEVAKFVRTKPLGAAGAAIILAMMAVAGFAEPRRRTTRIAATTDCSSPARAPTTGLGPTSSAA